MDVFNHSGGIKENMYAFDLYSVQETIEFIPMESISCSSICFEGRHLHVCVPVNHQPFELEFCDLSDVKAIIHNTVDFPDTSAALMHPVMKLIALKGPNSLTNQDRIRMFYVENGIELAACDFPEKISFWKWIDHSTIGLASETSIFLLQMREPFAPIRVLSFHGNIKIMDYQCDHSATWLVLTFSTSPETHSASHPREEEKTCIYSLKSMASHVLDVSPVCFGQSSVEGGALLIEAALSGFTLNLRYFTINNQEVNQQGALGYNLSIDVDEHKKDVRLCDISSDSVFAIKYCSRYGWIYVITKDGLMIVFDAETTALIYILRIPPLCFMSEFSFVGDFCGISTSGQVILFGIKEQYIVPHVAFIRKDRDLAKKIASRTQIAGAEFLIADECQQLIDDNRYEEAALLVVRAPRACLSTPANLRRLLVFPNGPGTIPVNDYFGSFESHRRKLSKYEFEVYHNHFVGCKTSAKVMMREDMLMCSEELGDFMKEVDLDAAMEMYMIVDATRKLIAVYAQQNEVDKIFLYCNLVGFLDYFYVLKTLLHLSGSQEAVIFAIAMRETFSDESIYRFFRKNDHVFEAEEFRKNLR